MVTARVAIMDMVMPVTAIAKGAAGWSLGLLVLLLLIVIGFAWLGVKQGLADKVAEDALQNMLTWQTDTLTTAQVQQAYELMLEANELDAGHPTYLHRLGRLSHLLMALDLKNRARWGALAKTYYRQSLAVRPAWPLTWANLALVKADLLEFDGEMAQSLQYSAAYGPYEPGVLTIVAGLGLRNEAWLTPAMAEVVNGTIQRGLISRAGGTAQQVFGLLANHSPGTPLNPALRASLEDQLGSNDWARNTDQWVNLALEHWDEWSSLSLPAIRVRLLEKVTDQPRRLRRVSNTVHLLDICPYLPRKPEVLLICTRGLPTKGG